MAQTRLTKLRMEELSGVDDPANELPGWIVQKSKGWKSEVEEFEKSVISLFEGISGEHADLYFVDAPEDVTKARETLIAHLAAGVEDVPESEGGDADGVKKGVVAKFKEIFGGEAPVEKSDVGDEEQVEEGSPDNVPESSSPETEPGSGGGEGDEEVSDVPGPQGIEKDAGDETVDNDPLDAEAIVKSVTAVVKEELEAALDPIREAIGHVADRTEDLEKHSAGRTSLTGQESDLDEGGDAPSGLAKAVRGALINGRVELT